VIGSGKALISGLLLALGISLVAVADAEPPIRMGATYAQTGSLAVRA
jgi:hypothetical protein